MHIIDAIVLAKLLSTLPARRVLLHTDRCRSEEGDQRNEIDLRELAGRVRTPPDGLVGEVAQARQEAERLLKLGAERGYEALAFDHAAYPAVLATRYPTRHRFCGFMATERSSRGRPSRSWARGPAHPTRAR